LDRFPQDGQALIAQIKEREHEGDELTQEVVSLLNRTFVTPFDRDDMYRLAGAIDDVCDHVDEAADNLGSWGVDRVPEKARAQAQVILKATTKLRSEEHTSELQSRFDLVCRLLLEKKKTFPEHRQLEPDRGSTAIPLRRLS